MRDDGEAVSEVCRIRLGMIGGIFKLEILHEGRHEDEEAVLRQALAHADAPADPVRHELLVADEPEAGLRLLEEPFRSEHLSLGPHVRVLHEAPEVGHGE